MCFDIKKIVGDVFIHFFDKNSFVFIFESAIFFAFSSLYSDI